jgi:signal transduction histidine kinase
MSRVEQSDPANLSQVVGWFINLRWIASAGVGAALAIVSLTLRYPLPYRAIAFLTILLVLANAGFTIYFFAVKRRALSSRQARGFLSLQIWCDYILLFLLVYCSGFLENPFSYYFVFHLMLTSFISRGRRVYAWLCALLALIVLAIIGARIGLFPTFTLDRGVLPPSELARHWLQIVPRAIGLVSTLAITAYLVTSIKNRLEEKGKWFEVELERYRSLDRIKSDFMLQVTHELRGPLAAINGYHEMIVRGITGAVTDRTRETVMRATRRADNLLQMIDEMIDYAYMKSDQEARYMAASLDAGELVERAVEQFSSMAKERNIRLVADAPRGVSVRASRDLVAIILSNLITNSIKYSPAATTVTIAASGEGDEVHFTVKDQGMGIEEGELEKVFEEFYRTRRAREREKDGTGLGLAIIKRAVESLHGSIKLYSEVDSGTEFHVRIPKGLS